MIPHMPQAVKRFKPALLEWLCRLLLVFLVIYVLACICFASLQRRLIYFPPHYTAEQVNAAAKEAGLERWTNSSGQPVGMKRLSPRRPADGQVLIVYGNGSWTAGCAHYADQIQVLAAFDVFILEYPGYADRPGSPSQESIFHAADEALQLLDTNKPVFLLGESLGSGVAAYLAGTQPNLIAVCFCSHPTIN